MMEKIPMPQQIYRHFKGNLYQIVTLAEHSETGESLVIYQAMYGEFKVYARPLSMFMEKVDKSKYPGVTQEYRFEPVNKEAKPAREMAVPAEEPELEKSIEPESGYADEETGSGIDPLVMEFLDADSYEERLNILAALQHRITDEMINTMAVAIDVEVQDGEITQRYEDLKKCLLLYDKFECNRMR